MRDGRFIVGQGGGVTLLNHHADHEAQRYATDIVGLNAAGFHADGGLAPKELERYAIYGATIVSPCDGRVVDMRDGLPDLTPPERDREHAAGNMVTITCAGAHVVLAHMQKNSVMVAQGEVVSVGEIIGRVGNSGNTTEPHLHIHAIDPSTGLGAPLTFDGRAPLRNQVYRREPTS